MVYQAKTKNLAVVWDVHQGSCNDVVVCRDLTSPVGALYTLLILHDRTCVHKMLSMMDEFDCLETEETPYIECFVHLDQMCFIFPYQQERNILTFAQGQMKDNRMREQVCINFLMQCLTANLPYPLLHLMLCQNCVHIREDNSIYFTYTLDLSELRVDFGEHQCVSACLDLMLTLLESRKSKGLKSYNLLQKKRQKNVYRTIPELYRDIKLTVLTEEKQTWQNIYWNWWSHSKDGIFRVFTILCAVLVAITLLMIVTQILFGDIPWLRLFQPAFEQIGTETLIG